METQKQLKKLREAQSSATPITSPSEESTEDVADKVETTPKKGKVYTAQEIERFAKELEIIKVRRRGVLQSRWIYNLSLTNFDELLIEPQCGPID
jgi:hypothetical protein